MMLTFFIRQQTGAMFGLDARISLAIFGVLSIDKNAEIGNLSNKAPYFGKKVSK